MLHSVVLEGDPDKILETSKDAAGQGRIKIDSLKDLYGKSRRNREGGHLVAPGDVRALPVPIVDLSNENGGVLAGIFLAQSNGLVLGHGGSSEGFHGRGVEFHGVVED